MSKKAIYYLLFFVVLFFGFVYAMNRALPGFTEVKLPVLSRVQPFHFLDQEGREVTERTIEGKVYVAEYFFTTCKGICPKMNTNMKKVYEKYRNEKGFAILSHSVDPETDSVGRMKTYADSLGVNGGNWYFLTGRKDSLYHVARVSYLLDDPKNNNEKIEDQFIHTQFFALVDKKGQVRKIYDGLKQEELEDLMKDIPELLKEKTSGGARFANGLFNNNPQ
ncbi:SCO family protein [Flavihumibacter rivuli]|uniref:SCO family protein n=1 Tax=Flavihumibacter rivuli TaxID=2838156 RepID=UPI001BDE44E5|nr:SCO family protein [Flavihumibacter rivuli]ULQ55597.1 SCO family protein [Flavihumibacter rivuli]